jgi:chemotaxis methyl-accepting protein methylase
VNLAVEAEKRLGLRADAGALEKLRRCMRERWGGETPEALDQAFLSGEVQAALTVNETYFFREPAHFRFLQGLLPSAGGVLRVCSGASASGCEAYSIAMLIEDYNRTHPPVSYRIDAFDVNPRVIETAESGVYGRNAFRDDGSCFRYMAEPYLSNLPGGGYRVNSLLKKNIRFFAHNVLDFLGWQTYDVVFFRNAFIYFTHQSKARALSNIADALADRGLLITGVSETAGVQHPRFIQRNQGDMFYFEKRSGTEEEKTEDKTDNIAVWYPEKILFNKAEKQSEKKAEKKEKGQIDFFSAGFTDDEVAAGITGRVQRILAEGIEKEGKEGLNSTDLAVSAVYLLNRGDFSGVSAVLDRIEKLDDSSYSAFLRGEYFFFQDRFTEAELYYRISLGKDNAFWPAGYRLSLLAGADASRRYRAEQTLEGIGRAKDAGYEVFIGGFSPDYYAGALLNFFRK